MVPKVLGLLHEELAPYVRTVNIKTFFVEVIP